MSRPVILLLNGPNLDLFGVRDPAFYGSDSFDQMVTSAVAAAESRDCSLEHVQSAAQADLVTAIHGARNRCAAIVINGGAFTHYAWAVHDALQLFDGPVVELHVSNTAAREAWRQTSVIAPVATGLIAGFGGRGYAMAVNAAIDLIS